MYIAKPANMKSFCRKSNEKMHLVDAIIIIIITSSSTEVSPYKIRALDIQKFFAVVIRFVSAEGTVALVRASKQPVNLYLCK